MTTGAYVKTPGLSPEDPNAINFLTVEQLHKLKARVETAISRAHRMANFTAGTMVELTRTVGFIPNGSRGVVVDDAGFNVKGGPTHRLVQFIGREVAAYVPTGYLVKAR